ncbi:MAG: hypothetical protein AAGE52_10175 [Myxococcota bacterium]
MTTGQILVIASIGFYLVELLVHTWLTRVLAPLAYIPFRTTVRADLPPAGGTRKAPKAEEVYRDDSVLARWEGKSGWVRLSPRKMGTRYRRGFGPAIVRFSPSITGDHLAFQAKLYPTGTVALIATIVAVAVIRPALWWGVFAIGFLLWTVGVAVVRHGLTGPAERAMQIVAGRFQS